MAEVRVVKNGWVAGIDGLLVNWFCEVDEVFTVRIDGLAGIFVLEIGDGDRFGFLAVGFCGAEEVVNS
ncbi:hypothetical protein M0R45_001664 [Rubus argutus]|uniref:Uncharacterized protein n=1 Tax=Rubus argutus TaxID=59490 RepID=A0AAW1VHP8_RUBAR